MYIKKVVICDFLSYKGKTVIDDFAAKQNIILGRNGSGKSNFLTALEFVLSDEFRVLSQQKRISLMHSARDVRSAYVSILFRDPVKNSDLLLSREITATKDVYLLNSRKTTKKKMYYTLQSSGISTHNPYNIMQQSRIREIAIASCTQRLHLLQEVFGIELFRDRVQIGRKMIENCTYNASIERNWAILNSHYDILKKERDTFVEFKALESRHRACLLFVTNHEIRKLENKIAQTLPNFADGVWAKLEELQQKVVDNEKKMEKYAENIRTLEASIAEYENTRKTIAAQKQQLTRGLCRINLNMAQLERNEATNNEKAAALEDAKTSFAEKQRSFDHFSAEYERKQSEIANCRNELFEKQKTLDVLRYKKKHPRDFHRFCARLTRERTQEYDRAVHKLTQNIEKLESLQARNASREGENHVQALQERQQTLSAHFQTMEMDLTKSMDMQEKLTKQIQECRSQLDSLSNYKGLYILDELKETLPGYHGFVRDVLQLKHDRFVLLFDIAGLEAKFATLLVDNETVTASIDAALTAAEFQGRVNYLYIETIPRTVVTYPTHPDVLPFLEQFDYNAVYAPVLTLLFGRTLICANSKTCLDFAKRCGYETVCLEGRTVSKDMIITDGFRTASEEQLKIQQARTLQLEIADLTSRFATCNATVQSLINEAGTATAAEREWVKENVSAIAREQLQREIDNSLDLHELKNALSTLNRKHQVLKNVLASHQQSPNLTDAERAQLRSLPAAIQQLKDASINGSTQLKQLELEKKKQSDSIDLLKRNCASLEAYVSTFAGDNLADLKEQALQLNAELTQMKTVQNEKDAGCASTARALARQQAIYNKTVKENLRFKTVVDEARAKAEALHLEVKRLHVAHFAKLKERDDLGTMPPPDILHQYEHRTYDELAKEQKRLANELAAFEHVDPAAMQAFEAFSTNYERLQQEHAELNELETVYANLGAAVLEQQAQEEGFAKIDQDFGELFNAFVLEGSGSLVKVHQSSNSQSSSSSGGDGDGGRIERWTGVDVRVQFPGSEDVKNIWSLSGGEKTLISLVMLFAIQRQHPAPFYVLDEADAQLDEGNRNRLAVALRNFSNAAQYIFTSHCPELVQFADKHYWVNCFNGKSYISAVSKEEASSLIAND